MFDINELGTTIIDQAILLMKQHQRIRELEEGTRLLNEQLLGLLHSRRAEDDTAREGLTTSATLEAPEGGPNAG